MMKPKIVEDIGTPEQTNAEKEFYINSKPNRVKILKRDDVGSTKTIPTTKSCRIKYAKPKNDEKSTSLCEFAETLSSSESIDDHLEAVSIDQMPSRGTDTSEGRTLFVRNLSFDVSEERFAQYFSTFGELEFAKIVRDKSTQHSRGTGFVKFVSRNVAENILLENSRPENVFKFTFAGRPLKLSIAVSRDEVAKLQKSHSGSYLLTPSSSDTLGGRNLQLARIGIIRPGTPSAAELTPAELAMRESVLRTKQAKLRDSNIFISPLRLCLRNIPLNVGDKELRQVCRRIAGPGAQVTECRVMRNVKSGDKDPKSMGFAFVAFEEHKDALKTLQVLNNNNSILGGKRKPIVEFSLENSRALQTRRRRAEKCQMAQETTNGGAASTAATKNLHKTPRLKRKSKSTGNKKGMRIFPKKSGPKIRHKPRQRNPPVAAGGKNPN